WQPSGVNGIGGEISGSPESVPGSVNTSHLPAYLRTDLSVERRWSVSLLGRPGTLTTLLLLGNVLNRHNVLGFVTTTGSSPLRTISYPSRSLGLQVGWEF
ncbi:MAG: hypothetical protein ABI613_07050, partial [Gemmatimonadota bacterium]